VLTDTLTVIFLHFILPNQRVSTDYALFGWIFAMIAKTIS